MNTKLMFLMTISLAMPSCAEKAKDEAAPAASDTTTADDTPSNTQPGAFQFSSLSDLPTSIGPVQSYGASDTSTEAEEARSFNQLAVSTELTTLAEDGASFGATVQALQAKFDAASNPSKAMCDVTNQSMKFVFEAGGPDSTNCMIREGMNLKDATDIYDGEDHIYKGSMEWEQGVYVFLVKLNVKKVGNEITSFTFHSCSNNSGSMAQERWFQQTFDAGNMTIESKMSGPTGSISHLKVNAKINDEGKVQGLKDIVYLDTNTSSNEQRFVRTLVTQSDENVLFKSYTSDVGGTYFYSFYELLDKNTDEDTYAITKLALGDGAALVKNGGQVYTEGWNGDTFSVDATASRLGKVEGKEAELPTALSTGNTTYTGDEVFDCDETDAIEVDIDPEAAQACMARYEIDQEGSQFCTNMIYGN
jgi:hypothetical protein